MQLITLASAAALLATVSADVNVASFNLNSSCVESEPKVRVVNRCSYPVHLWSVLKGAGCPSSGGAVIESGDFYQENFRPAVDKVGTSLKMSKTSECKGIDVLQLEYYIETDSPGFNYNYLDVSYVDCLGGECPTKEEGFYLKSGNNAKGQFKANSANEICPILSCSDAAECATMAYIFPDDRQTKSCDPGADLYFYACGGEAPGAESDYTPAPSSSSAPSSSAPVSSEAKPSATSSKVKVPAYSQEAEVAAAAITPSAVAPSQPPHIKTEVVYVTAVEYVNAKRHPHGHRHQHFRA